MRFKVMLRNEGRQDDRVAVAFQTTPSVIPISVIPISVIPISVIPISVIPISVIPISVIPISVIPISVIPISVIPIALIALRTGLRRRGYTVTAELTVKTLLGQFSHQFFTDTACRIDR
eukprot:7571225-Pyramimonas_sp.AAC.1